MKTSTPKKKESRGYDDFKTPPSSNNPRSKDIPMPMAIPDPAPGLPTVDDVSDEDKMIADMEREILEAKREEE